MINQLQLTNFRNFETKEFEFSQGLNLILGDNGAGKTNALEAIFLLTTGKSFRATKENQMINETAELARVEAQLEDKQLAIVLTQGELSGQPAPRKRYLVDGVPKQRLNFIGQLYSVLFRPEDIDLIIGSPSQRRQWLDTVLEMIDWQYRRCNLSYQKGLRQRNKLLQQIREAEAQPRQLLFWDKLLIKNGQLITQKRRELIEFVNQYLIKKQRQLEIIYDQSEISLERLAKYSQPEIGAGMTLVGPHRDDFIIQAKHRPGQGNLALFGSRGEQRMGVLTLKLAELAFVEATINKQPVLLLDDIFSELDENHRQEVWQLINQHQTILSATDEDLVGKAKSGKIKRFKLLL